MSNSIKDRIIAPHVALVLVQFMFGTWPLIGKIALRSLSSTSLVGFRIVGAAIVFSLLQRKAAELFRLPKRVIAWLLLSSLLGVVINQLIFVKGLSLTTAINATLLTTTVPVFILLVSITDGIRPRFSSPPRGYSAGRRRRDLPGGSVARELRC